MAEMVYLGVEGVELGGKVEHCLCLSKSVDDNRLATASVANHHCGVTGQHGLVQLHNFVNLVVIHNVVVLCKHTFHRIVKVWVADTRAIEAREQIPNQTCEGRWRGGGEEGGKTRKGEERIKKMN